VTEVQQAGFDPRLEWGAEGAAVLARVCPVLVVVDVLRFTSAVEVGVARGAVVVPRPREAGRGVGDRRRAERGPRWRWRPRAVLPLPRLGDGGFAQLSWPG
jgi:2-phosphosulfolactate phosphatase